MDFTITSKTPIFTGGIDSTRNTIRETGIMGSLRWWYEAIIRGAGQYACDPTASQTCSCGACQVFGSTAGAKKFSIVIDDSGMNYNTPRIDVRIGGGSRWRLPEAKMGELALSINGIRGNRNLERHLAVLLQLMANWGGIGAKNYIGYGVFYLAPRDQITDEGVKNFVNFIGGGTRTGEPSLSKMFFSKITLDLSSTNLTTKIRDVDSNRLGRCENLDFLPTAAHVRYSLRAAFRDPRILRSSLVGLTSDELTDLRHYTIGELGMRDRNNRRQGNQGAKIASSHLYRIDPQNDNLWQMRVWGYIPRRALQGTSVTDTQIIADLQTRLSNSVFWQRCFGNNGISMPPTHRVDFRYFNQRIGTPPTPRYSDFPAFLNDLITNP